MPEMSALHKCRFSSKLPERRTYPLPIWMLERCFCTLQQNCLPMLSEEARQGCLSLICSLPTLVLWTQISRSCSQDEQPRLTYGYDCRPHPQSAGRTTEQSQRE